MTIEHNGKHRSDMPKEARIPTAADNPNGLHQKYIITKYDGRAVDADAAYFVLRLDRPKLGCSEADKVHFKASHKAIDAYIEAVGGTCLSGLAFDLDHWAIELKYGTDQQRNEGAPK